MAKFMIEPHFRLQEWVAEEKGYFVEAGLDYEFREFIRATGGAHHRTAGKAGAFQSIEKGREANVTCACHWTVNVAASRGHTKLYADAYSVAPSGIFVPADSPIRSPEDLAGVPISVGYQSGSHYATIQVLEPYLPADRINLSFGEGMLFSRMEAFLDGTAPAAALFNGPYYFAEQLGFRKVIDSSFMIAAMINGDPDLGDIGRYFQALRRAQRDIDVRPDLYTHYYAERIPRLASMPEWTPAAGDRASASCSSPTARTCTRSRSNGSPSMASLPAATWVRDGTKTPSSRKHRPSASFLAGRRPHRSAPLQFSTGEDADPPRMKLGLSCSSGPRASRSLMLMSERDARGPEEHEHLFLFVALGPAMSATGVARSDEKTRAGQPA